MTDAAVLTVLLAPLTTELVVKRQALESQWEADVADNNRRFDALLALHGAKRCPKCHGTGRKHDGTACVHMISCPCPKCNPYSM